MEHKVRAFMTAALIVFLCTYFCRAAEKPCTKENKPTKPGKRADKRGVRKQTAYRVSQPGPSK